MKYQLITLLFITLCIKAQSQSERNYLDSNGMILMNKITPREFVNELILFERKENYIHEVLTVGKADSNWITKDDIEYFITLINSKQDAKCISRSVSSYISAEERATIGDHMVTLIEAYINKEAFPNNLMICTKYNILKKKQIIRWWKKEIIQNGG